MEKNEIVYAKMRSIMEASEIDSLLSAIILRMESEIRPDSGAGRPSAPPKAGNTAEEGFARQQNESSFFFQQGKYGFAVSCRQYMIEVARLAGWLRRWELQGERIVIAVRSAYGQSAALFAAMAAGCSFSVFGETSRRDALETFLWEQRPAALICGRREVEIGKRYRESHDLKILQMSDNAENGLETVYI